MKREIKKIEIRKDGKREKMRMEGQKEETDLEKEEKKGWREGGKRNEERR